MTSEVVVLKKFAALAGFALCASLCFSGPSSAHHSFHGAFDESKELQISGTLTKVNWVNPHAFFEVEVPNRSGPPTMWRFENFPPAMLRNLGFSRTVMTEQIGKKVTVDYNPARKAGSTFAYGRVFTFEGGKQVVFTPKGAAAAGSEVR
jgi:hypothetical protein